MWVLPTEFVADAGDLVFEGAVLRHFSVDHVDGGEKRRVSRPNIFAIFLRERLVALRIT